MTTPTHLLKIFPKGSVDPSTIVEVDQFRFKNCLSPPPSAVIVYFVKLTTLYQKLPFDRFHHCIVTQLSSRQINSALLYQVGHYQSFSKWSGSLKSSRKHIHIPRLLVIFSLDSRNYELKRRPLDKIHYEKLWVIMRKFACITLSHD